MALTAAGCAPAEPTQDASADVPTTPAATSADAGAMETQPTTDQGPVVVGSKDFSEQFVLGEMYARVLEAAGVPVERKLNLGGSPVAHAALVSGEIDLYPEYTGTALLTILKLPVMNDPDAVFQTVKDAYQQQWNLVWLQPAPMNNNQALAMTRERSEALGITTISDMVDHASELKMIGPPEFESREDGLPGLKEGYGDFTLQEYIAVDPGLRYQGLVNGDADVAVAFGTDGEIAANDLVVLQDDKSIFPPYQVAPIVRGEVLDQYPEIEPALNRLAPKLTDATMRRLNNEVTGEKREPADVAQSFLTEEGLIAP
jgi:osmoprotectant transport system substrate-binding protein